MKKHVLLLLIVPFFSYAQTSKTATLKLNDYINLTTGTITSVPVANEFDRVVLPCTTSAVNRDFYVNYFNNSTCTCPCPSAAIGSPRPFYQSKKQSSELYPTRMFNLNDTSLFVKIDTVHKYGYDTGCWLPFVAPHGGISLPNVFIVKTSDNNYALISLTAMSTTVQCTDDIGGQISTWTQGRLVGYSATYYLNIYVNKTGVQNQPELSQQRTRMLSSTNPEYFSLRGQKLSTLQVKQNRLGIACSVLRFAKTETGVRLELK